MNFIHLNEQHTEKNLAEYILEILDVYSIKDKLFTIIGDNIAVNKILTKNVYDLLAETYEDDASMLLFERNPSFIEYLTHQFNLMIQMFLESINLSSIKKVKDLAERIYSQTNVQEL